MTDNQIYTSFLFVRAKLGKKEKLEEELSKIGMSNETDPIYGVWDFASKIIGTLYELNTKCFHLKEKGYVDNLISFVVVPGTGSDKPTTETYTQF